MRVGSILRCQGSERVCWQSFPLYNCKSNIQSLWQLGAVSKAGLAWVAA